ncbi:hypothetical protein [Thermosporothrix hazakensis]|uniref:hypothetical protein n=1 Tax=Thermosporothrix hazakensis TaxID=644383 RepID=UPI0010DA19C4|nr:hypothetical protein [Thermosporothrix hazakensis]GCE50236.1 hypothetical protein KTH_51050 [Thermosporothrix hazakensis]
MILRLFYHDLDAPTLPGAARAYCISWMAWLPGRYPVNLAQGFHVRAAYRSMEEDKPRGKRVVPIYKEAEPFR